MRRQRLPRHIREHAHPRLGRTLAFTQPRRNGALPRHGPWRRIIRGLASKARRRLNVTRKHHRAMSRHAGSTRRRRKPSTWLARRHAPLPRNPEPPSPMRCTHQRRKRPYFASTPTGFAPTSPGDLSPLRMSRRNPGTPPKFVSTPYKCLNTTDICLNTVNVCLNTTPRRPNTIIILVSARTPGDLSSLIMPGRDRNLSQHH